MNRSLAISCVVLLATGALTLASFQTSNVPEFAPEVQSGRVVTFFLSDFSTQQLLVLSRRGDLVGTAPLQAEILNVAERLVLTEIRLSSEILDFQDFEDWRAQAEKLRDQHRSDIARAKGWLENGNGPAEAARDLISKGERTIARLDTLEAAAASAIADRSKAIADGYKTSPIWINLRSVAGFRVD